MSENKVDRASLRRQAQRKESYASLISKRKYMLNVNDNRSNKRLRIGTMKNFGQTGQKNEEERTSKRENTIAISPTNTDHSSSDSCQDFQSGFFSNNKWVQSNAVQNELEVFPVMTRSTTRKYASVGALHNKVDWEQQMKVTKRWPLNVAYKIEGPLVQNTELRELLSKSLTEVMSFCKNVWTVNNEVQMSQEENQYSWLVDESSNPFDLGLQERRTVNESEDVSLQQQIINIISIEDEGALYIQQVNEECETITLHSDETYIIDNEYEGSTYFEQKRITQNQDTVYQYNPMIAVLNDHNYAQKSDVTLLTKLKEEHWESLHKEKEEEFKLETALNDLMLNTAMLKCLVCGESPHDMISFLDRAQSYLS